MTRRRRLIALAATLLAVAVALVYVAAWLHSNYRVDKPGAEYPWWVTPTAVMASMGAALSFGGAGAAALFAPMEDS